MVPGIGPGSVIRVPNNRGSAQSPPSLADTPEVNRTYLIPAPLTGRWARAAAIVMVGGLFASAASLMGPDRSSATVIEMARGPSAGEEMAAELAAAKAAKMPAFLGSLTSHTYRIDVYVGRNGPLYTIADLNGKVLAEQIRSDEVYARFPELDAEAMHAGVPTPTEPSP